MNDSQLGFFARDLTSLRGQIEQHVLRNPGDWTAEDLFEQLGAFDTGGARFGRFLERLVSADLIPDEPTQRAITNLINPRLREAGAELRETGSDGGYPVFSVVPVGAARHRQPKNLVFASQVKPDIRISDGSPRKATRAVSSVRSSGALLLTAISRRLDPFSGVPSAESVILRARLLVVPTRLS